MPYIFVAHILMPYIIMAHTRARWSPHAVLFSNLAWLPTQLLGPSIQLCYPTQLSHPAVLPGYCLNVMPECSARQFGPAIRPGCLVRLSGVA